MHCRAVDLCYLYDVRVNRHWCRHKGQVSLWDFSGFVPWATKVIPPAHDRMTNANWHWKVGYFKRELGDLIVRQGLGETSERSGSTLDKSMIDQHLAKLEVDRDAFRASRPVLAAEVRSRQPGPRIARATSGPMLSLAARAMHR